MEHNLERLVISRLLGGNSDDVKKFENYPFSEDVFKTYTRQFKYLKEFQDKYGKYPSKAAFKRKFNEFGVVNTKESMAYYCDQLVERENLVRLKELGGKMQPLLNAGKASEAIAALRMQLDSLALTAQSKGIDWAEVSKDHYHKNVIQKSHDLAQGVLFDTPYTQLNNLIVAMRSENLVTLSGRPAIGKTWCLLLFALHFFKQGRRVLLVSKEMSEDEFVERLDGIDAELNWQRFRNGTLLPVQRKRYKRKLDERKKQKGHLFVVGDTQLKGETLDNLAVDINNYSPDVVLVDSVQQYEVRGARDEIQKVVQLSRVTKRIAKIRKVLLIQTVHQNRQAEGKKGVKSGGLGGLSWGDATGRDSDLVFEIYSNEKEGRESQYRMFKIIKGRDTGYGEFRINFKMVPKIDLSEMKKVKNRWGKNPAQIKKLLGENNGRN